MNGNDAILVRFGVLAALALPGVAEAGVPECDSLKTAAERDADAGNHTAAASRYEELWNSCRVPAALYNIAVLQQDALHDPLRAWQWVMRYLDQVSADADVRDGRSLLGEIETELGRSLGCLRILPSPTLAVLYLDRAEDDARLERPVIWVRPGTHTVIAKADGHSAEQVQVEVEVGRRQDVVVVLRSLPTAPRHDGAVAAAESRAQKPEQAAPGSPALLPETRGRAYRHRVAGWALMGSGIGLAVLGGVLEGIAVKDNRDIGNAAAQRRWRDEEHAAWALMGIGLGALASGLAVYFTAPGGQAAQVVPWGPGVPGLAVQGVW